MRTDRIPPALRQLEPERRALLELSLRKGVSDEEIADLLRIAPADVRRRCDEGIARLSDVLGLEGPDERAELVKRLSRGPPEAWGAPSPAGGDRRRAIRLAGIAITAVALAAAAAAIVSTGADEEPGATRADRSGTVPRTRLQPVATGSGRGMVQLLEGPQEDRLVVTVRGLPPPGRRIYVVWLYRAVDDAKAIGGSARTSFRLNAPLPAGAARYGSLDISLESRDGNRSHGGDSVLRAPLPAR